VHRPEDRDAEAAAQVLERGRDPLQQRRLLLTRRAEELGHDAEAEEDPQAVALLRAVTVLLGHGAPPVGYGVASLQCCSNSSRRGSTRSGWRTTVLSGLCSPVTASRREMRAQSAAETRSFM